MIYPANHMLGSRRNGLNHVSMNLGDFNRASGPVRGTDYPIYSDALLDWYKTKNVKSVRLMFTWEAVQSALGGPVPASGPGYVNYWTDLTSVLTRLLARDIYVILSPWQYNPASGDTDIVYRGAPITSGVKVGDDFADFWGKFATATNGVTGNDQRVAFDLINEPHTHDESGNKPGDIGISLADWFTCAQTAIDAIRAAGATNTIFVPGMAYTDADSFTTNGSSTEWLKLTDPHPQKNIAVTVHCYTGLGSASKTVLRDACSALVAWARANNGTKVNIGEIAINAGNNGRGLKADGTPNYCSTFAIAQLQWADWKSFCVANNDILVGWNWWANSALGWWNQGDSCDPDGFHWGLTLDNGATQTIYMDLIEDTLPVMSQQLTKPLVVPEYLNALVKLYVADARTGATIQQEPYTINLQNVLTSLIPGKIAAPNSCALNGKDLFISNSSTDSQCIFKVPNYIDLPTQAAARTFIFTLEGSDYVGMAFDPAGNLYATEGNFGDNRIVKYTGAGTPFPGAAFAAVNNFATRMEIGSAGATSYFANLAFDATGNLWVSDYKNHRIVVFDAANLGGINTFHVLDNLNGDIPVANTNAALNANTSHLFAEPEGLDFDGAGNLWVANNNDGNGLGGVQTLRTSLVKLTPAIQQALLDKAAGEHLTPTLQQSNEDFFIYQVPNLSDDLGARPQFGGLQVDKTAGRIFLNEEQAKKGRWYDIATIEAVGTSTTTNDLDIVSTNPGNRGIALVNGQIPISNSPNSITAAEGGTRTDPEGFAPAGKINLITWRDSRNADRRMTLGAYLYQYDFSFDDNQQVVTRSANDDAFGHPGFGYVVSHNTQTGNSPLGKVNAPSKVETTVFAGGHHAIHRVELIYDRDKEAGGFGIQIPVVIEWFVATGRDHPVWAVTWKLGEAANPQNRNFDDYRMDVRGPYGSLNFDGAANRNQGDAIGGVAWGDFGLKFTTTDAQLTLNSPWTYNTLSTVCFTQAWTANENAEMGIVQTRVADREMGYQDRVVGRERGRTSGEDYLNKRNCTDFGGDNRNYAVPCVGGWPYQLMNFDWNPTAGKPANEATSTKLIAWGSPYGWLGASSFNLFDFSDTADGRGDRSYATFIVLGPKLRFDQGNDQAGDVAITIKAVEALNAATISDVNPGSLVTQAAKGPGATEMKNIPNGYNDSYAAYYLNASDNQVAFTFTPGIDTLVRNPIFVVQNYTVQQMPRITVDGNQIMVNAGSDGGAFVSLNPASNELWMTLNATINTAIFVQIT